MVSGSPSLMFGFVCVEGKIFEFSGVDGGVFPFRVTEFNRRKRFFVKLSLEEFPQWAVKWVRFCYSKGDRLWVKTFRWKKGS